MLAHGMMVNVSQTKVPKLTKTPGASLLLECDCRHMCEAPEIYRRLILVTETLNNNLVRARDGIYTHAHRHLSYRLRSQRYC